MKALIYSLVVILLFCTMFSCSKTKSTQLSQVTKPTFSLPSGVYTEAGTITVSCLTPESVIYYTLDGSEPNHTSFQYQNPIVYNKTTLLKVRAYKDEMEPSEVALVRLTMNVTSLNLTPVPGGTFTMGRTVGEGHADELPTHQVSLNSFRIETHETLYREWQCIMGDSPYVTNLDAPMYSINWYETLVYCNLRSYAENLTPCYTIKGKTHPDEWGHVPTYFDAAWDAVTCNWDANGYRLPTEAEWEYAARGAANNPDYIYAGSDSLYEVGWFYDNSESFHCSGCLAPNGLGLYDMSGNVWEWCWDRMDSNYYNTSPANNPKGPNSGIWRVFRGGSFRSAAINCRVAERDYNVPYYKSNCIGLRLVRKSN